MKDINVLEEILIRGAQNELRGVVQKLCTVTKNEELKDNNLMC